MHERETSDGRTTSQDPRTSGDAVPPPAQESPAPRSLVGLSTSSVYPETTASCFELAGRLGYDGVEVMVGIDPVSRDVDALVDLRDYHQVPVLSVHAPTLLVTQGTWGNDPWEKLERSAVAAGRLGADTVVVHPPFRWQRGYAKGFVEGVRRLERTTGIIFAVENMFPWRGPGGSEVRAYSPSWDPTERDYDHLTLDLSHASTSRQSSLELVDAWGDRLAHVHLTDGDGTVKDAHLFPGEGDQRAAELLEGLAARGFAGHVVLEVNTRTIRSRRNREEALADVLAWTRAHLGQTVPA
ncbi:sugar phosphate isomerase/epimerase family protein [Propioniciclava soli]|uniref:sugar phosphate isomerase/epimerase family protein n=1 Tax=Propioniciclava soli TaxID=2775081 RepID=UPI0022B7CE7D|nr:sugar phosphate isomerase/epimerase [Propioniciclava soli]